MISGRGGDANSITVVHHVGVARADFAKEGEGVGE